MALVVITGGVRSGKSRAACELAEARAMGGQPVVVAVFAAETDAEMAQRIWAHQTARPDGFAVVEATSATRWLEDISHSALLLLDCLGTCIGRAMLEAWAETAPAGTDMTDAAEPPRGFEAALAARVDTLVDGIVSRVGDSIVVTNEVGAGVVPVFATGRLFRDELGRANRLLVDCADAAYVAIAGRLLDLSALPRAGSWPED